MTEHAQPGHGRQSAAARVRTRAPRRSGRRLWWLALPLVPVQGMWLTRTIDRFPDADGVRGSLGAGAARLKVVALGDSVTAGYAVEHHRASVAGQLAARLAERYAATVEWVVCARTRGPPPQKCSR